MQLCTDRYSLSLCTFDTPCVHVVSFNLIFCCVIQNDRTPLLWASFSGHTEIVAMLLKFGADFSICDTVSTSYFITPISAVSEYVDFYTYVNIDLVTLSARMHSEGYCTWSVCLSVSTCSCATGTKLAHERYQRLYHNKHSKINVVISLKRRYLGLRNRHRRGPCCMTQPINYK